MKYLYNSDSFKIHPLWWPFVITLHLLCKCFVFVKTSHGSHKFDDLFQPCFKVSRDWWFNNGCFRYLFSLQTDLNMKIWPLYIQNRQLSSLAAGWYKVKLTSGLCLYRCVCVCRSRPIFVWMYSKCDWPCVCVLCLPVLPVLCHVTTARGWMEACNTARSTS